MRDRDLWAVLVGSSLAIVLPLAAAAEPADRAIRIASKNQTLAAALLDVAQQGGIELILAAPTARSLTAPKVHGRYSLDDALTTLLAGSGLTWRRSADGPYVV